MLESFRNNGYIYILRQSSKAMVKFYDKIFLDTTVHFSYYLIEVLFFAKFSVFLLVDQQWQTSTTEDK
jgi:hypothetical protein